MMIPFTEVGEDREESKIFYSWCCLLEMARWKEFHMK